MLSQWEVYFPALNPVLALRRFLRNQEGTARLAFQSNLKTKT